MSALNIPPADDYRSARDGGLAFPKVPDDSRNGSAGMSLRDWFAGQALAGICSDGSALRKLDGVDGMTATQVASQAAYAVADAMLAAREASR